MDINKKLIMKTLLTIGLILIGMSVWSQNRDLRKVFEEAGEKAYNQDTADYSLNIKWEKESLVMEYTFHKYDNSNPQSLNEEYAKYLLTNSLGDTNKETKKAMRATFDVKYIQVRIIDKKGNEKASYKEKLK